MIQTRHDHRLSALERLTHEGVRRRPRHGIEGQPARCPICNQELIAYVSRHGPRFLCGCGPRAAANGVHPH